MAELEGGDNSGANSRLVETIAANLDASWAEIQHGRFNEQQTWMAWAQKMTAEESHSAAMQKGADTRDGNYAAAGEHWRGVKAASNTQKAENATWRATRKDDREAAKDVQSASRGRAR